MLLFKLPDPTCGIMCVFFSKQTSVCIVPIKRDVHGEWTWKQDAVKHFIAKAEAGANFIHIANFYFPND